VLNCSAQDLYELRSQNFEEYERVFQDALFSEFIARLRVKQELVNDEQRLKAVGLVMTKLSYAAECAQMLQVINKYK
jgi:replication factor A1